MKIKTIYGTLFYKNESCFEIVLIYF